MADRPQGAALIRVSSTKYSVAPSIAWPLHSAAYGCETGSVRASFDLRPMAIEGRVTGGAAGQRRHGGAECPRLRAPAARRSRTIRSGSNAQRQGGRGDALARSALQTDRDRNLMRA